MDRNNLKKILHINTIINHVEQNNILSNANNISHINNKNGKVNGKVNMINNNIPKEYKLVKFVGTGYNNSQIYLAKYKEQDVICQISNLPKQNEKQLLMEFAVLDILSKNRNTSPYINPFIDYHLEDKGDTIETYTIFPLNTGYKLSNLKLQLKELNASSFRYYVKGIIRAVLHAICSIHKRHIAHQNIDDTSIIIGHSKSLESGNPNIKVKLVDFALSCGNIPDVMSRKNGITNDIYFQRCLDIPDYFLNSRKEIDHTEWKNELQGIIKNSIKDFKDSDYLKLAQSFDIWCCGRIFYDLIHCKDTTNSTLFSNDVSWQKTELNVDEFPNGLKYYGNIIKTMMLVPVNKRYDARTILDKIITHEKYTSSKK